MVPNRFFENVPVNMRRAISSSLGMVCSVLLAIAIVGLPSQASAGGAWCQAPYVQVAGQGVGVEQTGELQIQSISIGEPFVSCNARSLTVVIKVKTLDPGNTGQVTPPYNTEWEAEFLVPHNLLNPDPGVDQIIFVSWDTKVLPTGQFNYGFVDNSSIMIGPIQAGSRYTSQCPIGLGTCAATGTVTPDGTITINLDMTSPLSFKDIKGNLRFMMAAPPGGWQLTQIAGNTWVCACAAGNGTVVNVSATFGSQNYTLQGNVSCSSPPVAALVGSPTSGNAPLTVNFDASGSTIPAGGCGTIKSYIFDFGDGQQVTQSTPSVAHTYTSAGTYPARVRVTNTAGLTSTNNAEVDISVRCLDCNSQSVVSRVTHTGVGAFDIVLPQPPAPRGVECRSTGGNYKMVFTFPNNLISVSGATVSANDPTTGTGTVSSGAIGPNPNQYTVNLTNVSNAQYITVTVNTVTDVLGNTGNAIGTMGLLIGDVNANGVVTNADVSLVKAQIAAGANAGPSNFRDDVNANGVLSNADVSLTKAQVAAGAQLPSPP